MMIKNNTIKRGIAAVMTAGITLALTTGITDFTSVSAAVKKPRLLLNKKNYTLKEGKSYKLKAKKSPSNAKVTWKSSKKSVATVSSGGVVKAKKAGSAVITATIRYRGRTAKATCSITVVRETAPKQADNTSAPSATAAATAVPTAPPTAAPTALPSPTPVNPVTAISFNNTEITLNMGETLECAPAIEPSGSSLYDCNITSSKSYIAEMDTKGTIKADYIGTTYITIQSISNPDVSAVVKVNVTDDFNPPEGFDEYDDSIEHGTLGDLNYTSSYRSSGSAHALIWFPPGYDNTKEYNLLFCLHGGSDTEYYWTGDKGGLNDGCKGDIVLDNLYASGYMEDTIVVFPHGVIPYDSNRDYPDIVENPYLHSENDFWVKHYLLEFEIINDLLPHMTANYPVTGDPAHTAVCGLSMGCAQSMELGFKHPDLFDYVGLFSAGPFEDKNQFFVNSPEDAANINEQLKLVFFITGEFDTAHDNSLRNFISTCNDNDLNNVFYEVKGVGHDDRCWDKALYAFMKYAFK